ncbi:hypothetical protein C1645_837907 [Glomus cerebriforme]|uniref:Uncharacterized protein n=1 Tax=Glomus cerebriforme TaxID=658196 RepID=A0A397S390_9GLOM|nr:hypothetical protein C1645_837907 [Glomus cerebriforme]
MSKRIIKENKVQIIISEIEINEEYIGKKRSNKENIIEKEFNVNDSKDIVIYEGLNDNEDIIEKIKIAYELNKKEKMFKQRHGKNIIVCFGCSMIINVKEEKEELLLMKKEFRSYYTDCEKEELEVMDEILQENEVDEKENSDSKKSENNTDEESSNKKKKET